MLKNAVVKTGLKRGSGCGLKSLCLIPMIYVSGCHEFDYWASVYFLMVLVIWPYHGAVTIFEEGYKVLEFA